MTDPTAMMESAALQIVFDMAILRAHVGELGFTERRRLDNACQWLRENTDGMRVDPDGTPLTEIGRLHG
jgi:hypothetical protein